MKLKPKFSAESNERKRTGTELEQHKSGDETLRPIAFGRGTSGLTHDSRKALQRAQSNLDLLMLELQNRQDLLEVSGGLQQTLDDLNRLLKTAEHSAAAQYWQ